MATFMKETQHDIHDREREKKKRSVHPPAGDHRLAVNLSQDTMKMLNELVFLRRQRTYREIIESLIATEYEEQIAREVIERMDMAREVIERMDMASEVIERMDMASDSLDTAESLKPVTYKGDE